MQDSKQGSELLKLLKQVQGVPPGCHIHFALHSTFDLACHLSLSKNQAVDELSETLHDSEKWSVNLPAWASALSTVWWLTHAGSPATILKLVLTSASCQTAVVVIAQEPCPLTFPLSLRCFGYTLTAVTTGVLDWFADRSGACCCRHSQADLRAFLELPPPLVAHRAAADVAVLDEIVKGLARLAGVRSLEGLLTLDGVHKGSFQTYAGASEHECHQSSRCCLSREY